MSYSDHPGYGTTLAVKISASFTTINGVFEITWDGMSVAERNPTNLLSPNVRKKPGIPNLGEIKFKCYLDPNDTTHVLLFNRVAVPTQVQDEFKVTYNDGDTTPGFADVKGFVKEFNQSGIEPETGTLMFDGTIAVDTLVSLTPGTP